MVDEKGYMWKVYASFIQNHQYFSKDGGGKYYSGGEVSAA